MRLASFCGALRFGKAGGAAEMLEADVVLLSVGRRPYTDGLGLAEAGVALDNGGRVITEPAARRLAAFEVRGREREAVSVGSSEHFTLPPLSPGLTDVEVYLGWFGKLSRPMQIGSFGLAAVARVPPLKSGLTALTRRFVSGSRRASRGSRTSSTSGSAPYSRRAPSPCSSTPASLSAASFSRARCPRRSSTCWTACSWW